MIAEKCMHWLIQIAESVIVSGRNHMIVVDCTRQKLFWFFSPINLAIFLKWTNIKQANPTWIALIFFSFFFMFVVIQ